MSKSQKLWSLNALANELGRNMRTVTRAMRDVRPDGQNGRHPAWRLATALRAMQEYERKSDRFPAAAPDTLDAIDHAATLVQGMIDRMREETDVEKRRAILRAEGKCVGVLHRAFEADLAGCSSPEVEMYSPWVKEQFATIMAETLHLCEMRYVPDDGGGHEPS